MHPDVCRFVSDAFYESRLRSIEACAERTTSDGVGVRWLAVEHEGNRVDSEQEAEVIANEIERLVGHTFTDVGRDRTADRLRRCDGGRAVQRAGAPPARAAPGSG